MRRVINGQGIDVTNTVNTYLRSNDSLYLATLYLIGDPNDPNALWLTDWESPLLWSAWGTFQPAVIDRDTITSQVGLKVESINIKWSPTLGTLNNQQIVGNSPYLLAHIGHYDNWTVRAWKVYMPTPGDADTYGASELFGGWISDVTVSRGVITFKVDSFLNVINQNVPTTVVEILNTLASYRAATPPAGLDVVPRFNVIDGSRTTFLIADTTFPIPHQVFATDVFQYGYVVFDRGPTQTLGGVFSTVRNNGVAGIGGIYNGIVLLAPLPWDATPGVDTFYISAAFPLTQDESAAGDYIGFPFVPPPESAF